MRVKRKLASVALALCVLLTLCPTPTRAAETVASGDCGADIAWTLDSDGLLTFSGSGAMTDFDYDYSQKEHNSHSDADFFASSAPWHSRREEIRRVVIPSTVTSVGDFAFYHCTNLTEATLEGSVTKIGQYAFYCCNALETLDMRGGADEIGQYAFYWCDALKAFAPSGAVTTIGDCAFYQCEQLAAATLSEGLSAIGASAFQNCEQLATVTLSEGLSTIGALAFRNCASLTSVVIPESVSTVGTDAFTGCSNLTLTVYGGSAGETYALTNSARHMVNGEDNTVYVKCGYCGQYWGDISWKLDSDGNLKLAGKGEMYSYTLRTHANLNTGIRTYSAFTPWYDFRDSIKSVAISDGISKLGNYAFCGLSELTQVSISDTVTDIEAGAFWSCGNLSSVTLGKGVQQIHGSAFFDCQNLISVTLHEGLKIIGGNAFENCANLTSMTIPYSVSSMSDNSFENCSKLLLTVYEGSYAQTYCREHVIPHVAIAPKASGVEVSPEELALEVGETRELAATVLPDNARNKNVTWQSLEPTVASVDENGVVTALSAGTARIVAITEDGGFTDECSVTVTAPILVTGVSLDKSELTLEIDDYAYLTATVTPDNPKNPNVAWASSDEGVATVSQSGEVKALSAGSATITVTTEDGGFAASCVVTVNPRIAVTGVTLDQSALTLPMGASATLVATVSPENAYNPAIAWSSSDDAVATVDANGKVTMKAKGAATITVTTNDGGFTASCAVSTPTAVTGIRLNKKALILRPGSSNAVSATLFPENATNETVRWNSLNPEAATVDENGNVTAVAVGFSPIVAVSDDGDYTDICLVTVQNDVVSVTGVRVSPDRVDALSVGTSVTLAAAVAPSDATNQSVIWASSNPNVAAVSNKGTVTALSYGTATISATTADGDYSASCVVAVSDANRKPSGLEAALSTDAQIVKGSPLNLPGLTVYALYGNEREAVTDYALSGYNPDTAGKQTITVTYKDQTATFDITVIERSVSALTIAQQPSKREYAIGESLSLSGLAVRADYNDNSSETLTDADASRLSVSGFDASKPGTSAVTVAYGGKTASFSVTLRDASQTGVVSAPTISIYSYVGGKRVELSSPQGYSVYYTLDGAEPTASSQPYRTPIELTETQTVKAVAVLNGASSAATSGRVSVPKTATPTASHAAGSQLPEGTLVTFSTETGGANIYYTTDGTAPTVNSALYGSGVLVNADTRIQAVAVKEGCAASDVLTVAYTVPKSHEETQDSAVISLGSVNSRAGQALAAPVYIFTRGESGVTEFRFTLKFDRTVFAYTSVSPVEGMKNSSLLVSSDASAGQLTVYYQGDAIESGEMFTLNLNAIASAEDGEYPLTLAAEGLSVKTDGASPLIDVTEGVITLQGSHNSNLTGTVTFSSGGADVATLPANASKVAATFELDPYEPERGGGATLVNLFIAVYDRDGMMTDLNVWETALSNAGSVFMREVAIPPNVEVGKIKVMILSEDMIPLMAVNSLSA